MSEPAFKFSKHDLFSEKSLLDVYKIARLTPANGLNVGVTAVVFFVCCVYCIADETRSPSILALLRQLTGDAVGFTASILGFLVAGFTIFVTSKPEIFHIMARIEYEETRVSYLKYNLSIFLLVFIHYLSFTIYCVTIRVFFGPEGPAAAFLSAAPLVPKTLVLLKELGIDVFFVTFVTWLFYILMLLKSFIFNVYHIVMTGVALTIEDEEENYSDDVP